MFYVLDENKNLVEALDKEGVLALLEQAIEDGDLSHIEADSAFVSKLKSLVNGTTHHVEFVTQSQYNTMEQSGTLVANTYYFITDDDTADDMEALLEELQTKVNNIISGTQAVGNAGKVNNINIRRWFDAIRADNDTVPCLRLIWKGTATETVPIGKNTFEDGGTYIFYCQDADGNYYIYRVLTTISNDNWKYRVQNVVTSTASLVGDSYIYIFMPMFDTTTTSVAAKRLAVGGAVTGISLTCAAVVEELAPV